MSIFIIQAFTNQIFYPRYEFVLLTEYEENWWSEQDNNSGYNCSTTEFAQILNYSLAVQIRSNKVSKFLQ